jgi:trimeric autotransporter adhesin
MKKFTRLILLTVALTTWGNVANAQNNECGGWATDAVEGTFTLGYNYAFKTSGTDVTFTCECLDTKSGLVAYAWTYNPNFAEAGMTLVSGQKFTKTFSGQTLGATFSVACKFAFAGGLVVTKTYTYTVGSDCGVSTDTQAPTAFTAAAGLLTKNSVELLLNATDNNGGAITYTISYGTVPTIIKSTGISSIQKSYIVSGLASKTAYTFSVSAEDAAGNVSSNSPIAVSATTATPEFTVASWPAVAAGYSVDNLSDGIASTNWKVLTKTVSYLTYTFAIPKVFNTMVLTSGENTGRDPKDWTLEASNDSIVNGWTVLDTQTAQTFAATTTVKTFSFANTAAFKFYRLHVTAVNGSSSSTNLGELAFSNLVLDTQAPTAFTATAGLTGSSSVELLLNATDDSGALTYTISYGATPTVLSITGVSAIQKSYTVTGLTPSTVYDFSVAAKDASGNAALNSPITVHVTTSAVPTPTVSAPTPPAYAAAKVISIFSDAYANTLATINFNPGWGQSTIQSIIQVGTDNVLKYSNLNYQGTDFGSHVAPITMKYLHLDIWTADETSLQVFPICWTGTGNEPEKFKALSGFTLNQWNSVDIPMTDFTSQGLTMADVYQLKIVGSGGKTVYLDNIYFYDNSSTADTEAPTGFKVAAGKLASDAVELLLNATDNSGVVSYTISYGAVPTVVTVPGVSGIQKSYTISGLNGSTAYTFSVSVEDATGNKAANSPVLVQATTLAALPAAPTPTISADKVISIFSDAYTNVVGTNFYPGWGQTTFASASTLGGNAVIKYTLFNYQGMELGSHVNAGSMNKLHVDILPLTETIINLTPISPSKELSTSLGTLIPNVWNSFDILLSTYTGVVTSDIFQFKLDGGTGGTFYLDNLYFFNDLTSVSNPAENLTSVTCYPNPAIGTVTISAKSNIREVTLRNLLGQLVRTVHSDSAAQSLDLSGLSDGNYLVTVCLATGERITQKLVKM